MIDVVRHGVARDMAHDAGKIDGRDAEERSVVGYVAVVEEMDREQLDKTEEEFFISRGGAGLTGSGLLLRLDHVQQEKVETEPKTFLAVRVRVAEPIDDLLHGGLEVEGIGRGEVDFRLVKHGEWTVGGTDDVADSGGFESETLFGQ